ncbi:hypothetical protein GCM10027073_52180 [Streptomyces chlorus]|uniref:Secreted protein n=1 Tax=Streptomyces chlorus TaxID=887452 RepID=A0ABW1DT15_9ACTN
MRTKRFIAVVAGPLAAAALTFSPALMTQAVADTTQATTVTDPRAAGGTEGRHDGKTDGKDCRYERPSFDNSQTKFTKLKDIGNYESAYEGSYNKAFDTYCDEGD